MSRVLIVFFALVVLAAGALLALPRFIDLDWYRGTITAPEEVFGVKVHVSAMNVEVWIDAQERVRRMQMSYSTAVDGVEGMTTTTKMTITGKPQVMVFAPGSS